MLFSAQESVCLFYVVRCVLLVLNWGPPLYVARFFFLCAFVGSVRNLLLSLFFLSELSQLCVAGRLAAVGAAARCSHALVITALNILVARFCVF